MIVALLIATADVQVDNADRQETACYRSNLTQQGMNRCAAEAFRRADQTLNSYWKIVRAEHGRGPEWQILLRGQRAWLTYRDAWCESVAHENLGGTIWPLTNRGCLAKLTRERARQVRDFIKPTNE